MLYMSIDVEHIVPAHLHKGRVIWALGNGQQGSLFDSRKLKKV